MAGVTMMSTMAKPVLRPAPLARSPAPAFRSARGGPMRLAVRVQAAQNHGDMQENVVKAVTLSTLATSFLAAGNAAAVSELGEIAAGDGRFGAILLLFAPVLGWVLFNIGGPLANQFKETAARTNPKVAKRGVAAGLGLTAASMMAAQSADAATEVAQVAADGRFGAIALLFLPVLGWVAFNIGGPLLNQINDTASRTNPKVAKRGVVAGLGLTAASMMAAQSADAASEVAQVAADGRFGAIALLFLPVLGWVAFNIGGPLLNQFKETASKTNPKIKKRGVAAGLGLTAASMLAAQSADAATEVAQVAADGRLGAIAVLFVPVLGWVLFNIGGPLLNQFNETASKTNPKIKKRGMAAGLGLTAASMLVAQNADAASAAVEAAQQLNDNRFGLIASLFLPVLGWVGFNILEGAKNQMDNMSLK